MGGREGWDLVGMEDAAKLPKGFSAVNPTGHLISELNKSQIIKYHMC